MKTCSVRRLAAAALVVASLWSVSAYADPITVDWDVVPHEVYDTTFDGSPYYECFGTHYSNRTCRWLWEAGLTLEAVRFSFFDDKFFDGYGIDGFEPFRPGQGSPVERIRPECKPDLAPCFDLFTPLRMRISGHRAFGGPFPNLFITSSAGGLLKFPSLNGITSIDFSGEEWRSVSWLAFGFFLPAACESSEPPEDERVCTTATEKGLTLHDLTFEPVPEPAVVWLVAAGVAGLVARARPRRKI